MIDFISAPNTSPATMEQQQQQLPSFPKRDMLKREDSPRGTIHEMHTSYYRMMKLNERRQNLYVFQKPTPPPKRVTFAEDALLYSSNVTIEEVKRQWYVEEDYKGFKKDRKDAVRLIKKNGFKIDNIELAGNCLRGFECYFSLEINRKIKLARETAVRNVLKEQYRQYQLQIFDEEAMSMEYGKATHWIRANALQLAANDAAEVQEMVRREQQQERRGRCLRGPNALSRATSLRGVTKWTRSEFMKSSAMQRSRSSRNLMAQVEEEQETRHHNGVLRKLENALQLVGKIDLSDQDENSYIS